VTTARLTRKESQAQTRSRIMDAATRVFAAKGLERASVDEVAAEAGYTKGAFYANFESKEELFLAILDERFEHRVAETRRVWTDGDSPHEQARDSTADFARAVRADPETVRLFLEFKVHALRNERFRDELVARFAGLRERLEEIYGRRAEEYGLAPHIPIDRVVRMVLAMCDGWELWMLLEPEAVDERLLEELMEAFTVGLAVMSGAPAQEATGERAPTAPA
jgi:AcrR family transcriptional regulator